MSKITSALSKGVNAGRGRDYTAVMCGTSGNIHHGEVCECRPRAVDSKEAVSSGASTVVMVESRQRQRQLITRVNPCPMLAGLDPGLGEVVTA